jgi:TRAP-type mannitol/chloroaromatic compound transport system substrate-binding protein
LTLNFSDFSKGCLISSQLEPFAKNVAESSGRNLTIKIYYPGELAPPLEAMDAVIDGKAEIGKQPTVRSDFIPASGAEYRLP